MLLGNFDPHAGFHVDMRAAIVTAFLLGTISSVACHSPAGVIRPVIYARYDEAASAMRSAPLVVVARISDSSLTGNGRCVEKAPEVGGPMCPRIPLHLARITADIL